jgi:SAM-dependent methyltransferase
LYDEFEDRMQADFPAKVRTILRATKPARLLDVGCGKGYFVRACVDAGINAEGIDLSQSGVRFAREELGVACNHGDLREMKGSLGQFDVVTFWATIEHLPDPIGILRCIGDVLAPYGRLYLDTGIGDDWLDRLLPGRVQWYDPPQHLFVFSAQGLRLALARAGFQIVDFNPSFERTPMRRIAKTLRNGAVAGAMRAASELGFAAKKEPTFVRFPMGNLMAASAVKLLA